jgi:hypothetical protein
MVSRQPTVRERLLSPTIETRVEGGGGGSGQAVALRKEGRVLRNILIVVYLVVGVVVANSHHYFTHLNSLTAVLSALLAVLLWPLVLFGVSLHIK